MAGVRERNELLTVAVQIALAYSIIITSLINLSLPDRPKRESAVWITLLTAALGYLMPTPGTESKSAKPSVLRMLYRCQLAGCFAVFITGLVNMTVGWDQSRYWLSLTTSIAASFLKTPGAIDVHKILDALTIGDKNRQPRTNDSRDATEDEVPASIQNAGSGSEQRAILAPPAAGKRGTCPGRLGKPKDRAFVETQNAGRS